MSWDSQTDFINTWIAELETLIYELKLPDRILGETRRLLTRAVDEGFAGPGRQGAYLALSCFYLACRMTPVSVQLDRFLSSPLGYGLGGERLIGTVRAIQGRLAIRICMKCGVESEIARKFCSRCGTWLPLSIVSKREEERCLDLEQVGKDSV